MKTVTTVLLACLSLLLLPLAAQAQLAPVETFFTHPEIAQPRLSPSGRWLAVLLRGTPQRNTLAVLDLQTLGSTKAVARFTDADIQNVRWVGDDSLVFDVIDLQAGSGERRFAPGLFSVSRDGANLRELVKLRNDFLVRMPTGTVDRRLEYNHLLLQVPRLAEGAAPEVIVGEINFGSRGDVQSVLPKRLDVATGRVRRIAQGAPDNARHWLFDAAGEPRVVVAASKGRTRVHWRAPGQDDWVVLQDAEALNTPWAPHSLDAAGNLYVTTSRGPGRTRVLTRFDFAAGRPAREAMVDVPGFDFDGQLITEREGGRLLGVRAQTDGEITVWTDARMKALQEEVDRRLPGRVNRLTCRRCDSGDSGDGNERVLLIESWSDRDPGSILVWRGTQGKLQLLGRANKQIDPARMATLEFQRFVARDGRQIPVWLTQPNTAAPPAPAAGRPAVVLVHGGPWVRGGHWGWHAMPQFLASRGYVVIEPEFRGSTGYGTEHFRAGWRQWGQAMQDDVADAVLWAAQGQLIDPKRVCIAGASYGGYATLMGLVRHPELYRCGAAWVAVTEPLRLLERSWWWEDDVSEEARQYSLPAMLADAKADAEMLKAISPVQQAARIRAPVLLAFGELDRRVPLVHGKDMREALIQAGREPEWIVYPEEGHGWRKLENQHDFARRLEAFFARHLAP